MATKQAPQKPVPTPQARRSMSEMARLMQARVVTHTKKK